MVMLLTVCCSKSDNAPGAMKWIAESPLSFRFTDHYVGVDVPAEGYTFVFRCTNYPSMKFVSASPSYDLSSAYAVKHTGFYFGKIEDNIFTIEFIPDKSGSNMRTARITVAAGDETYDFTFVQTGSE